MMAWDELEFERVVALKRTPLFRALPFETLLEVARSVQARVCLAGEELTASSAAGHDLLVAVVTAVHAQVGPVGSPGRAVPF